MPNSSNATSVSSGQSACGTVTRPIDSFAHVVAELRRIKAEQARLSAERKTQESLLKAVLIAGGAEVGTLAGVAVVSFTSTLRIALSQKVLKARYPEIAKECSDITEVETFRLLDA
jgi:hypothetical protein